MLLYKQYEELLYSDFDKQGHKVDGIRSQMISCSVFRMP